MTRASLAVAIALGTAAAGCARSEATESAAAVHADLRACAPDRGPGFAGADCGTIRVFEDRQTRKGRMIDVAFARWRAETQPAAGAVMLLAGGPGANGDGFARDVDGWARPLRATLDIVVVDQRGTGRSNSLYCARDVETDPASSFGHIYDIAWLRRCRSDVEQRADPRQYTTDNAADDLDEVRAALGYEQVSLYGGSYGTRLAQVYMRRFPQRARSVVIDGVLPMDGKVPLTYAATARQAVDRVVDDCAQTPACRTRYPALAGSFKRLVDRFRDGPVKASVTPRASAAVPVVVSRGDFGYAIRGILYSARGAEELPGMIARAAATGDVSEFAQRYWERQVAFSRTFSTGLHLSVLCAEDVPFIQPGDIAGAAAGTFLGEYLIDEYRRACAEWPAATIPAEFTRPVSGSVPTLLISGYFDPVTPPAFADAVARTLSVSRHEVARPGAHGSVGFCFADALLVLQSGTLGGVSGACR